MHLADITLLAAREAVSLREAADTPASVTLWEAIAAHQRATAQKQVADEALKTWLDGHAFAAEVHEVMLVNNHPISAGKSLDAFLQWCTAFKRPDVVAAWVAAGHGSAAYTHLGLVQEYIGLLGLLGMRHGRDAVDTAVDTYAAERLRVAEFGGVAGQVWQAYNEACSAFLDSEPESCALLSAGMGLWTAFQDIDDQKTEDYWLTREERDDAGLLSSLPWDLERLRADIARVLHSQHSNQAWLRSVMDQWRLPSYGGKPARGGVVPLFNLLLANRLGDMEPWWAVGYQIAARYFGPDATLGAIGSGQAEVRVVGGAETASRAS